jgi:hypothetical protein
MPALNQFLRQDMHTPVNLAQSLDELEALFPGEEERLEVAEGLSLPQPMNQ